MNPDEWWPKLESAISSILNPDSPTANTDASLEELYQAVENLCGKNAIGSSAETYQKLKSLLHDYVNGTLLKPFLKDNERLLPLVDKTWQSYCVQLRMIRNIFLYLDRNYVLQSPRILSIWFVVTLWHKVCALPLFIVFKFSGMLDLRFIAMASSTTKMLAQDYFMRCSVLLRLNERTVSYSKRCDQ